MKQLPDNVKAYKRTPTFTEETVPEGLLNNHNTKAGVWGLIQIEEGKLEYTIENEEVYILTKENHGIVEPGILHHIKPLGKVFFSIEFYK
jgi:tellurite resistance-related uncharacterized protein